MHSSANLLAVLKVQREDIRVIKAFRPHEDDENTHRKRINSKTHSKVDKFENVNVNDDRLRVDGDKNMRLLSFAFTMVFVWTEPE